MYICMCVCVYNIRPVLDLPTPQAVTRVDPNPNP